MKEADLPQNESARIALLNELDILDTLEEQAYDDLTFLASKICDTPIALISLIDSERQWFKSHHGLEARETSREYAFCSHAILDDKILYVPDSEKDERFHDNPLVTGAPHVKFYAGMPLKVRGGLQVGTLCVIDNKARTLDAEQLKALESLGRQAVSQLNLRLQIKELKVLEQMEREFIAMVSHELRTPLTSIYGSLSLIESKVVKQDSEKFNTLINVSYQNSIRLKNIVDDILEITRLESGLFKIKKSRVNINKIVKDTSARLEEYFKKCHVHSKLQLNESLPEIECDPERIEQVLSNLFSNAAKFSSKESVITVSTHVEEGFIKVSIEDQGVGIPQDKHKNLFDKFSKLDMQKEGKLPGTGLGLHISKEIIELHDGTIGLASKEGKGSTFFFTLPISSLDPS